MWESEIRKEKQSSSYEKSFMEFDNCQCDNAYEESAENFP